MGPHVPTELVLASEPLPAPLAGVLGRSVVRLHVLGKVGRLAELLATLATLEWLLLRVRAPMHS